MGIPIGYNIKRDENQDKDVLRADVTGQRSPIRRRIRLDRPSQAEPDPDTTLIIVRSRDPVERLAPPRISDFRRTPSRQQHYQQHARLRAFLESTRPPPTLTPGFAPAAVSRSAGPEHERASRRRAGSRMSSADLRRTRSRSPQTDVRGYRRRDTETPRQDGLESFDNIADSHSVGFPPLRRMGRRTITDGPLPSTSLRESWSPASTLDGLGDRDRSVSPFEGNLPWETFLSTVVPDPVAPTAHSSFASAAAASFSNPDSHSSSRAGSSNSHSASSSHTHLTVPSRRQSETQFMRACESSSDDTASDTEEDDMIIRPNPATLRRRARPSYFSSEPPARDTERYSHRVLQRSRAANAYVNRFYSARTATDSPQDDGLHGHVHESAEATRVSSEEHIVRLSSLGAQLDHELREVRSLLERLSRRDDIGDDLWALVGLTRSFADRIARLGEGD